MQQCCGLTLACPPFRHPQGSPKESIAYVFGTEVGRNAGWEPRASTYQSRSLECVFVFLGIVSLHRSLRSKLSYFAVGFFQTFQESYGMCSRSSGLRGRCCHDLSLSSISDVAHLSDILMPKLKRQLGYVGLTELTAIQRLGKAMQCRSWLGLLFEFMRGSSQSALQTWRQSLPRRIWQFDMQRLQGVILLLRLIGNADRKCLPSIVGSY